MLLPILAICVGASVGALARWGLALWFGAGGLMPWGTLAANLIGGYLIGLAIATFQLLPDLDPVWRLALVTGFLGGLTTFSSFSAEVTTMLLEGRLGVALLTASAHLGGSFLCTWVGIRTVQALSA
jgi:CrcB protein